MFATAPDGTKLWCESVSGTAPRPVLLLHGFASDTAHTWESTGWLRALTETGYVTMDLRGHGQSERAAAGYSPENLARDAAAVLDAVEVSTVDVVSYSMGGLVAWELAKLGRVRRMVLGGIGSRSASREDMLAVQEKLGADTDLTACIDGIAGRKLDGLDGEAPAPVLFVAGDNDEIAAGAPEPLVVLRNRNHFNAVPARAFKEAALRFFGS